MVSHSSPSLCLPMTLASIRSFGHLVAWCGLGPVPEISWACQLDQSVCPAIRALCHPPLSTPCILALLTAFPRLGNGPASPLCKQPSRFPAHRCWDGTAPQPWLHAQDLMAEQKEQIWFSWVKKVTLGMDTSGGCHLCVFYGQCDPFLMRVVIGSAGVDGTTHATLLGLKCWARASDLSQKKHKLAVWNYS